MEKTLHHWLRPCLSLLLFLAMAQGAWAQNTYYQNKTIKHKPAKWHAVRSNKNIHGVDDFDENIEWQQGPKGNIQATHTSIQTIYARKGSSVLLHMTDHHPNGSMSNRTYQRWYNYQTDDITFTGGASLKNHKGTTYYQLKNGYVGQPISKNNALYQMDFAFPKNGADYYLIGCDVSGYQDFREDWASSGNASDFENTFYEPTLGHRFIFMVRSIEDKTSPAYQALKNGEPIEVNDIAMPATRITDKTQEMVALQMDARSYLTLDEDDDEKPLVVTIPTSTNVAGIKLLSGNNTTTTNSLEMSDEDRIIYIQYPKDNGNGTRSVNIPTSGKSTSVIEVKRGNTVVAKFNLTFNEESRLLTQTQVGKLEDESYEKNGILKDYIFRTPSTISNNYQLLTEMNFDYDASITSRSVFGGSARPQTYPFPMGWDDISYGFFDGTYNCFEGFSTSRCPEWGYYGILNGYVEVGGWSGWGNQGTAPDDNVEVRRNSHGEKSTYHLYIDASDRPGIIARLPFTQPLCNGTELFVTAWVKCARYDASTDNASVLFTVMGVKQTQTQDGKRTDYIPIYRFQTGQIPYTLMSNGVKNYEGFEQKKNDWMQVYFSFINDADANYESYVLQVDNNSASTNGGDIYIDDIRVYIATPDAKITQLEATCTNARTKTNIELDWERLTQRLGVNTEVTGDTDPVTAFDFCFVDANTYNNYLKEHEEDYTGAIEAAIVEIGDNVEYNNKYVTIYFHNTFDKNKEANMENGIVVHPNMLVNNKGEDGNYYLYRMTRYGEKYLTGDFYGTFVPNREYWMLMKPHSDTGTVDAAWFAQDINSPCAIRTPFMVSAQTLIRVNGQVTVPTSDYCAGQVLNFTAQVRVPTGETDKAGLPIYKTLDQEIFYDWFFGEEEEFTETNEKYGVSLGEALKVFREIPEYRDHTDMEEVTAGKYIAYDGSEVTLTQGMIDIIRYYLEEKEAEEGGVNRPLVLHESSLNITLLADGLQLVVQPIPMIRPSNIKEHLWEQVCWTYVPLTLSTNSKAPGLHAGFNLIAYPDDNFSPNLRIGLKQIELATKETTPLTISLRGASYASDGEGNEVDHLGMITNDPSGKDYTKIYLVSTDDPEYKDLFSDEEGGFDQLSLPIGQLKALEANEYMTGTTEEPNEAQVVFDTKTEQENGFRFQPKEGYTYTFTIYYQEIMKAGNEASTACYGMFTVPMKVVPEYLVWQGKDGTANWNNDENWKRADKSELKKTTDDTYATNEANTTSNGFVPMLFSKVVMPANSKAHLYMAGYAKNGDNWYWYNDENKARPEGMEAPTENIAYDLMAYEKTEGSGTSLSTERYRVNLCDEIHFEPGAQMLHAEQLIYDKAWMDISLPTNTWTAISTPLQEIVAGDWYTQSATGTQETPYFTDITFNTTDYNRLKPAVYQRSWSAANIVGEQFGGNVSFTNNWSSTYNDTSVPYEAGEGYSISGRAVVNGKELVFRMPKADERYDLASGAIQRDESKTGKLLISGLYDRDDPETMRTNDYVSVTLTTANGDGNYLMVGNPYMAELDVQKFLEANSGVLAQQYNYVNEAGETAVAIYNTKTGKWESNGVDADNAYIKPYGVFYALPEEDNATSVEVKFSAEMQRLTPVAEKGEDSEEGSETNAMTIEAGSDRGTSMASVCYSAAASDSYLRSEDAALLTGIGEKAAPRVFTAADNTAITVNQLKEQTRVPLGVYADADETVTLTFRHTDALLEPELYDAKTKTSTPLYEGYQVVVTGDNFGQYFIITKGGLLTGIEEVETATDDIQVNSLIHRQVVVTANSGIEKVSVWTANGTLAGEVSPNGETTCSIEGVPSGVAVVKVKTTLGEKTVKTIVK